MEHGTNSAVDIEAGPRIEIISRRLIGNSMQNDFTYVCVLYAFSIFGYVVLFTSFEVDVYHVTGLT